MAPVLGRIGPFVLQTYTFLLDVAILASLASLAWQGHRYDSRPAAWLDAGLLALVGGIIGGRLAHVAIHWAYFSQHTGEIVQVWRGGLNWHGAIAAGLAALWLACRLWYIDQRRATDALAFLLPLGAALTYTGCLMSRCAHGREVPSLAGYPPLVVTELPDLYGIVAPRLSSQLIGIVLSLVLLAVAALFGRLIRRPGVRFWPVLALLGLMAFGVGFTRGDAVPPVGTLRLDQVLDLVIVALSLMGAAVSATPHRVQVAPAPSESMPDISA